MPEFVIPNEDFVARNFNLVSTETLQKSHDDVFNNEMGYEGSLVLAGPFVPVDVENADVLEPSPTIDTNESDSSIDEQEISVTILETIEKQQIDSIKQEQESLGAEARSFEHARTIEQLRYTKTPSTTQFGVIIDSLLDSTFKTAEAVVANRLAHLNQIKDLVMEHEALVNAVLALAEEFSVMLPSDKIDYSSGEIMRVNVPVTRNGCFTNHELAIITILLRKKMESFPQTSADLNAKITTLTEHIQFRDAKINSLKKRQEELLAIKPNVVSIFIIKRQDRDRYLYLDEKKKIKSSKVITKDVVFTDLVAAETALIYAIKNLSSSTVKKIPTYEIIQMSYLGVLPASPKLQESRKRAYK